MLRHFSILYRGTMRELRSNPKLQGNARRGGLQRGVVKPNVSDKTYRNGVYRHTDYTYLCRQLLS